MPSPPTITLTAPCHLTVLAAILRLWPDGRLPNRRTLTVTKRNEMIAAQLAKMPGPAPTTPDSRDRTIREVLRKLEKEIERHDGRSRRFRPS